MQQTTFSHTVLKTENDNKYCVHIRVNENTDVYYLQYLKHERIILNKVVVLKTGRADSDRKDDRDFVANSSYR